MYIDFAQFDYKKTERSIKILLSASNTLCIRDCSGALFAEKGDHPYFKEKFATVHAVWHEKNGMELLRYFHKWSSDCDLRVIQTPIDKSVVLFEKMGYRTIDKMMVCDGFTSR